MKVKVLKRFIDAKTGKVHMKDEVIDVSKKRFDEINENAKKQNAGVLVEVIKEEKTTKEAAE